MGLWIYNPIEAKWKNNIIAKKGELRGKMIRCVNQDIDGRIWISRDLEGIDIYDKRTGIIENLQNNPNDERSLQNNDVNTLFSDKERGMWIGTLKKGVSYYNESAFKFDIKHVGDINCIEAHIEHFLCLGTTVSGLFRFNVLTVVSHKYNI